MKPFKRNHGWENIWRRNVNQNITYNSPSNILQDLLQFKSYGQNYYRSRRQFPEDLLSINGLRTLFEQSAHWPLFVDLVVYYFQVNMTHIVDYQIALENILTFRVTTCCKIKKGRLSIKWNKHRIPALWGHALLARSLLSYGSLGRIESPLVLRYSEMILPEKQFVRQIWPRKGSWSDK